MNMRGTKKNTGPIQSLRRTAKQTQRGRKRKVVKQARRQFNNPGNKTGSGGY